MNYKWLNAIRYSNRKIPLEIIYEVTVKHNSCIIGTLAEQITTAGEIKIN